MTGGFQKAFFRPNLIAARTLLLWSLLLLPALPLAAGASEPLLDVRAARKLALENDSHFGPKLRRASESASESLRDSHTARKLGKDALLHFGPKSAGIRYDARMIRAAQIAEERAHKHSIRSCWRYVKEALLAAEVVQTYPKTTYAKQAGEELLREHGFCRLPISDPFKAPLGSVLVYGGRGAGHVEIRTDVGFVSDFESRTPSKRPLLGIYVKPS